MDIHRCRFVPYPASSINALAFSHPSEPAKRAPPSLRLALGRANGDIEIWDPAKGAWIQEAVLRGGKNRSIEGLAWTQEPDEQGPHGTSVPGKLRLFSIGYSNAITEWNLASGLPARHSSGNYGEVWCLAAQPRWREGEGVVGKNEQLLAVGCSDGTIVLHSTAEGELNYVRTLQRSSNRKARVLSLTFSGRNTIIAGCSDSSIWVYDIRGHGRVKNTMTLGMGPKKSPILVWSVKCLSSDVLVSGDSTGELKFWDLKTASVTQRVLCHEADVLTVAPSADGLLLFSGGMDRKVCILRRESSSGRWKELSHQRVHASHVKAMASFECRDMSVVVSGGLDSVPVVMPLEGFGAEHSRMLPGLPGLPPLVSAPAERLMVSWWDREVAFCQLDRDLLKEMSARQSLNLPNDAEAMQRILIQGEENITSVSISADGERLAIATSATCKLFALEKRAEGKYGRKVRKISAPASLSAAGARLLQFSPDGRWLLVVRPDSQLYVYPLHGPDAPGESYSALDQPVPLRRRGRAASEWDGFGLYRRSVCRVAWSSDSRLLACGDLSGQLDAWMLSAEPRSRLANGGHKSLPDAYSNGSTNGGRIRSDESDDEDEEEDEDAEQAEQAADAENAESGSGQRWRAAGRELPKLSSLPLVLSFRPRQGGAADKAAGWGQIADELVEAGAEYRLVAVTSRHEVYEFDARAGKLSAWSKRNPPSSFADRFRSVRDRAMGCVWDVAEGKERMWLYGSSWLWMFDLSQDMPGRTKGVRAGSERGPAGGEAGASGSAVASRKRKRNEAGEPGRASLADQQRKELMKGTGGAGSRIAAHELRHGLGSGITKTTTTSTGDGEEGESYEQSWLAIDQRQRVDEEEDKESWAGFDDDDDDDDDDEEEDDEEEEEEDDDDEGSDMSALARLRREEGRAGSERGSNGEGANGKGSGSGPGSVQVKGVEDEEDSRRAPAAGRPRGACSWYTFKYRPILGVVPLGREEATLRSGAKEEDDDARPDIEVALVERPIWETDADLPFLSL